MALGDGTFYQGTVLSDGQNIATGGLAAGNFSHNGRSDIVAGLFGAFQVALFTNLGDGRFQRMYYASGVATTNMLVVDLNNDGKLDIVITNYQLPYRPASAVVIFGK